jgi:hypothetical protein
MESRSRDYVSSQSEELYHWVVFKKDNIRIMIIRNNAWYQVIPIFFYRIEVDTGWDMNIKEPVISKELEEIINNNNFPINTSINDLTDPIKHQMNIAVACRESFKLDKVKEILTNDSEIIKNINDSGPTYAELLQPIVNARNLYKYLPSIGEGVYYKHCIKSTIMTLTSILSERMKDSLTEEDVKNTSRDWQINTQVFNHIFGF